ncbi:MAG: UDP-N-acetylmuramate--L-alanine ligase [Candidatus Pacebacteria bacterium]|nr:UDP-N-acetylmuramate--L-alanine ligase [Candidatus Paceibacterota bacterium]MCF7856916.1 UDP-N-acetylmuramate--L-alanine ligase [Candidatus Paceibacterota bacterium]
MKLSDYKKAHFIGIGGIGMSGLARLFLHGGKVVSGSDRSPSDITRSLMLEGASFFESHAIENITDDIDLVIYTEAVSEKTEGYVELQEAKKKGITTINYFDALGMVANEYYLIAVSGSHGKTTTTAMLIDIFEEAGLDPSAIVGSLRSKTKSNYRAGKSKYFIVEACEYKRDFLSLTPDVLVITNIEHEHVDYYKNLREVQQAFSEFAGQVRDGGSIVLNFGGQNVAAILEGIHASIVDYGKYFDPTLTLKMPGVHNQLNAAVAKAVAELVGIDSKITKDALQNFTGTWRRFEYKGEVNGAKVYDDYGHHPTEIEATINGAKELYPDKKITLVFQSHTYSRTHALFNDFVRALSLADRVIVLPVYAAREENISGVSHTKLVEAMIKSGEEAHTTETFVEVVEELKNSATKDDLILIMGAGDVTQVAGMLTK